jgi:hypothetical protein
MTGETQQYNDLTHLYGTFSDGELENLALTFNDLIEPAQKAIKAEFGRRGMTMPLPSQSQSEGRQDHAESPLQGFAANAPEDCTFEFTDIEEAYLAQSVLRSAGIESVVPTSEIGAIDTPRLVVSPSDAHTAELILSRPTHLASGDDEETSFVEPACPECGAPDPMLESVEPTNQWRCEACNHLWRDADLA